MRFLASFFFRSTSLGSKIHAQRKFAQGASITIGHSPVKHAKISIKKRVEKKALPLTPTFIPAKRPKTEDFLTFLCYRGESAVNLMNDLAKRSS